MTPILTNEVGNENSKSSSGTASHATDTPPRSPTTIATSAHALIAEVRNIHHLLSALPTLKPGSEVNTLLTRLVDLCVIPYSSEFTAYFFRVDGTARLCEQLRPLCATAEGELEKYWAQKITQESILSEASPVQNKLLLNKFPYKQNYIDLSRIECLTIEAFLPAESLSHRPSPKKFAFIGSGPLPLTSLCILDIYPEAVVHNVDRDLQALQVSQELCDRLGYCERMSFACEDVSKTNQEQTCQDGGSGLRSTCTDWESFDVVFLAALVGMDTQSKLEILTSLGQRLKPGTLVVARSAQGLRAVLYPILEISEYLEEMGLEMLVEVHPWTKVVNSVIVLRVMKDD